MLRRRNFPKLLGVFRAVSLCCSYKGEGSMYLYCCGAVVY